MWSIRIFFTGDYGFSSSHVWMWELDYKERWASKNWCFWTVVLEKTLESPLDCKEIQPVHPKDRSWVFIGRTDVEPKTPILWPPDVKNWLIGKDPDAGTDWRQEKETTGDEMVWWHHRLDGHEFELALWADDGQGSLACCSHGVTKSQTQLRDWTTKTTSEAFGKCFHICYFFNEGYISVFLSLILFPFFGGIASQ